MNGSSVSQPPARELNFMLSHTHTGMHSIVHWSNLFIAAVSLWKPPPPNMHHQHITPTTVLCPVILWAIGKRYGSMTERNGLMEKRIG